MPHPDECPLQATEAAAKLATACRRRGPAGERRHRARLEEALRIQDAVEAERHHLARELHDELGQRLVTIQLALAPLAAAHVEPWVREAASRVGAHVNSTVTAARRLVEGLRPQLLEDLGLPAALARLADEAAQQCRVDVSVRAAPAAAAWPRPHALALYRVAQECLTNIARHARATRVRIDLRAQGGAAQLVVEDDGVGLNAGAPGRPGATGLHGMRERVALLGGELALRTPAGGGTRVHASIPLHGAAGTYRLAFA